MGHACERTYCMTRTETSSRQDRPRARGRPRVSFYVRLHKPTTCIGTYMSKTSAADLYDLPGDDKRLKTRCRACGRPISNYYMVRVNHGRKHVRLKEAEEVQLPNGHVGFTLVEQPCVPRAF